MTDTTTTPAPASVSAGLFSGMRLPTLKETGDVVRRGDVALAIGIMTILVVLIVPLPSILLDLALAVSIIFSILILMTSLFIQTPLEFSSFPTVLLIATMLRLALNLASTRLILAHGHEGTGAAGHVIQAFGQFVMGGNFVIGLIVFSILIVVNFVVITKGSGRIAEVAARFTLDAMPGKQMAIDADLGAGLINEAQARDRRSKLEQESAFFGAMDGASKFVRGDAVAGLLITFINVIGGIIIGVVQNGLTLYAAGQTYTLLTVGDGIVSQIPALVVSTAAGLLVSKAGVSGAADKALIAQFTGYPTAIGMSSVVMVVLATLPGMPTLTFLLIAAGMGFLAFRASKGKVARLAATAKAKLDADKPATPAEEPISTALRMDELKIELGYAILPLINAADGTDRISEQIKALRRQIASDFGFVMPPVRLLDNVALGGNDYVVRIKEVEAGKGQVYPNLLMVMDPAGGRIMLKGIETTEPTFGLAATWIEAAMREEAVALGYTVVDPATVLSTHLSEVLKANASELLSYANVQKLLSELSPDQRKLVEDLIPSQISVSGVQRVLQALLAERISIRDLPTIMEGIAEATGFTRNIQNITEHVRSRLGRQICAQYLAPGGYLPLISLSGAWEHSFMESLVGEGDDKRLAMAPSRLQEFVGAVRDAFEDAARKGEMPVLMTSQLVRPYVRSIVERFRAHTTVMSQSEVHPRIRLKTVGSI